MRKPQHYWTLENTVKELKQFIRIYPMFKGYSSPHFFTEKNRDNLKRAIYKYGGLRKINDKFKLGLVIKRKTWSKQEVFDELNKLNKKGEIINQNNLSRLGRHDLLGAINKFGTLNIFKEKMGLPLKRYKYWSDEKIISELKPIIKDYGRIPNEAIFSSIGKRSLLYALEKNGGIRKFCQLLQTTSTGYYISNDGHYLQSGYECFFDNILFKYGISHEVHGKISNECNYRYDFLVGDVYLEICGYNKKEHPQYYKRLKKKIKLYNTLKLKHIIIYKESFNDVAKTEANIIKLLSKTVTINQKSNKGRRKQNILPMTHWSDIKNVKKELRPLVKKYGRFPLDRELRKERKSSLIHGIYKYHGSFYELGKKIKIKVIHKPKGYFTQKVAVMEYKQLSSKAGHFLSLLELQDKKCFGLARFIAKNGGFYKMRELTGLNFSHRRLPNGYYTENKAIAEYKQLCITRGRFVPSKELIALGAGSLAEYIQKTGGYYKIRKKTGLDFPQLRRPSNFWTENNTKLEYQRVIKHLNKKPSSYYLKEIMRQDLLGAITKFGGLNRVNKMWGNWA